MRTNFENLCFKIFPISLLSSIFVLTMGSRVKVSKNMPNKLLVNRLLKFLGAIDKSNLRMQNLNEVQLCVNQSG